MGQERRWTGAESDGWAILALPPGRRDLGCRELWERSLARSRRRREAATVKRRAVNHGAAAKVSAALLTAAVVAPAAEVAHAAGTRATASSASGGLLRKGSRGPDVAAVQRALGVPADGIFGRHTRRAVRRFQAAHGLVVDGVVGPVTARALGVGRAHARTHHRHHRAHRTSAHGPRPSRSITRAVQEKLGVAVDGEYGPVTRHAVRRFQRSHGLVVDGVVGPQTLAALGLSGSSGSSPETRSSGTSAAVAAARSAIGTPYRSAGTGRGGFDCSGLTQWAMGKAGISLPRTSYAQYGVGSSVGRRSIRAGDLVFFDTSGGGASHVGIATSGSRVISATTHGVMEHSISGGYWGAHYIGARRV